MQNDGNELVIVGMACRLPGASSTSEYWQNLIQNKICTNQTRTWDNGEKSIGGFLSDIKSFDADFFNISPAEAICINPQIRLLLEVSYHAIQSCGVSIKALQTLNTGVFTTSLPGDYKHLLAKDPQASISPYSFSGNAFSAVSGRLSYFYDFHGPSISLDTACSSGLSILSIAKMAIQQGQCGAALIGGASLFSTNEFHALAQESQIVSTDNHCYAFDGRANGLVPAEGVVALVVMQQKNAEKYSLPVLAQVHHIALNHDGLSNGIMAPNASAQASLIKQCFKDAQISLRDVAVLEAHGTGTKLGDAIECAGLRDAFSDDTDPCYLGTSKMMIGHTLVCSGLASIVKLILSYQNNTIPANPLFDQPPQNTLVNTPFQINKKNVPWPNKKQFATVSAFGFTGSNAHVVLKFSASKTSKRTAYKNTFIFSADDSKRLRLILEATRNALQNKKLSLQNLTTYLIRQPKSFKQYRCAIFADSHENLHKQLSNCLEQPTEKLNQQSFGTPTIEKTKTEVNAWLTGKIDYLADTTIPVQYKVQLPLFPFYKTSYWIGQKAASSIKENEIKNIDQIVKQTLSELLSYSVNLIDGSKSLFELGLDSLSAVSFTHATQKKGIQFKQDAIWNSASLNEFIASCQFKSSEKFDSLALSLLERKDADLKWLASQSNGPPVVLLPPLNCNYLAWTRQITHLQAHGFSTFIPYYPSQLNHDSEHHHRISLRQISASISRMIRRQKQPVHLVGWSLGGVLAQLLAIEKTTNIASINLVATAVSFKDDFLDESITLQNEIIQYDSILKIALKTEQPVNHYIRDHMNMTLLASYYQALLNLNITAEQLNSIQIPTQIIIGAHDPIIDQHQQNLLKHIRHAKMKVYPDAGHFIPLCQAKQFNHDLVEFINQHCIHPTYES